MNEYEVEGSIDQENAEIFQSNIRQIETTNRLLAHIEDKLNNLIYNKKASPKNQKFSAFTKKNAENQFLLDRNGQDYSRGKISVHENGHSDDFFKQNQIVQEQNGQFFRQNPTQQQDEYQENYQNNSNLMNQAQLQTNSTRNYYKSNQNQQTNMMNRNGQNQFFNQGNNGMITNKSNRSQTDFQQTMGPNQQRIDDSSSNRNKLDELNYLLLGREEQDPSPSQISSGHNQQILGGTLEYTKSHHFNSGNKQHEIDTTEMISSKSRIHPVANGQENKFSNQESQRISNKLRELNGISVRSPQNQQFQKPQINDDSLVQRIDRMDKFYENKIKILSERVGILESENQVLIEQKSDLNLEIIKLKQTMPISASNSTHKFSAHEKGFKDQERKIIRLEQQIQELSLQNTNLEREKNILVDSLQHEIQDLKNQNYKLIDENQSLRSELRERNLSSNSMRKQNSSNSLINYYKGHHQPTSQTSRNNYQVNEESHQPINTIENTANILEDIRNKYNIPRAGAGDKRTKQQYDEDQIPTRSFSKTNQDSQLTLNDLSHKANEGNFKSKSTKGKSEISFHQQQQQQQQQQFNNEANNNSNMNQMSSHFNLQQQYPSSYQQESKMINENSYSFLDEPSTRRNRVNMSSQADHIKEDISKIKDELNRQKIENMNMVQKITDFKSQNGINYSSQNSNSNHQSAPAPSEAQLMLENYKLYASQLEKSYEKIEQLYQKDVQEKQSRINQLSQPNTALKKSDLEEESQYRLKPKLKTTKTRKTSVTKKQPKATNSITTLQSIGRSKSVINTSKKV